MAISGKGVHPTFFLYSGKKYTMMRFIITMLNSKLTGTFYSIYTAQKSFTIFKNYFLLGG